jgi:hypothetical protein
MAQPGNREESTMIRTPQLLRALMRRMLRIPFILVPEGRIKTAARLLASRFVSRMPAELLVSPGETVLLVGSQPLESVMTWSDLVDEYGRVVHVDGAARNESLRTVLEVHAQWPLRNIVYASLCEGQSLDNVLAANAIAQVHHVDVAADRGVEVLASLGKTLARPGVRVHVRTALVKDSRVYYPQLVEQLRAAGFDVAVGRDDSSYHAREVYAARPGLRRSPAVVSSAPAAR